MSAAPTAYPLHVFKFRVEFDKDPIPGAPDQSKGGLVLCAGAFSECTGLEATMEPKVIKEGGRNYGPAQRAGQVTFATVILKRGITSTPDLYTWFEIVNSGGYAYRLAAIVTVFDTEGKSVLAWRLEKAMPIKFKTADLNAKGTEVGIEELHIAHEGLTLVRPPRKTTLTGAPA
jgi:phage tail-like protein